MCVLCFQTICCSSRVEMVLLDHHRCGWFVASASPPPGVAGVGGAATHCTHSLGEPSLCWCDGWARVFAAEPLSGCRSLAPLPALTRCPGILLPLWPSIFPGGVYPHLLYISTLESDSPSMCVLPSSLQRHRWGRNAHCGQEPGPRQWVFTSAWALAPKTLSCLGSPCHPGLRAAGDEGRRGTRKGGDPANAPPPAFPAPGSVNPGNKPPGCALQTLK